MWELCSCWTENVRSGLVTIITVLVSVTTIVLIYTWGGQANILIR